MRAKVVVAMIGAMLAASSLSALAIDELDVNFGIIYIGTTDPGASGPSIVTPLYGVSLPIQVSGPFFIEPMLELYTTFYQWTGSAVAPAAMENAQGFLTLGTLLSFHGGMRWAVAPALTLGASLGIDFLLRFPIEFLMADQNTAADTSSGLGWFFGAARFIYPEARVFLKWQVSPAIGLVLNLRAWYPLFQLWDGQSFPFPDQFMFAGGIGFAVKLGRPAPVDGTPADGAPAAK
jgi:hypothetical protein